MYTEIYIWKSSVSSQYSYVLGNLGMEKHKFSESFCLSSHEGTDKAFNLNTF